MVSCFTACVRWLGELVISSLSSSLWLLLLLMSLVVRQMLTTRCEHSEWAILAFVELIIHTAMFTDINVVHDVCNVVLNGQRKRNRNQFCTEWTVFSNVVVIYEMKSVLKRLINSTYNASEWRCQLQNFGFMYLLML